jgi:ketosteroid isomerase-like protein
VLVVQAAPVTSREEIESVVGGYARAWVAGDLAAVIDAYHPEFTLHYGGTSPLAGTHEGRDAALAVLAEATTRSARELVAVDDVLVGDDHGALVVRERLGPTEDRRELRRVLVYTVADGRLRTCRLLDEDQAFVDRLWSRPAG